MARLFCSHCGQLTNDFSGISIADLSRLECSIVEVLANAGHRAIPSGHIADVIYADRPDGGPLNAAHVIKVHVCNIRRKIEPAGWTIRHKRCHGYRLQRLDDGQAVVS